MPFQRTAYLEWAKQKPPVSYNLAVSSVPYTQPGEIGFSWEGIPFCGANSYGYPPLIEAIASYHGVSPDNVATATGTSMANFLVCAAMAGTGDEVIVEQPAYGPLCDVPAALGATVKRLERRFEDRYTIDTDALRRLVTKRTRLLVLTTPHNPTGVRIPDGTLREIGRIARAGRFHVLVDEVYLDYLGETPPPTCFSLGNQFIATSSLTKVFGLDGLRCGWIVADRSIIRRVRRARDFVDGVGAFPAEVAASRCFASLPRILARSRATMLTQLPIVREFVESQPGLSWVEPDGGVVCFPRHRSAARLEKVLRRLPETYDTIVVPGRFFESPAHFRLGFGMSPEILVGGLERLRRALAKI
jgi:aspartate/methionine/tyrosine aminotransferase